jgi:hypothetical protein
MSGSGWRDCAVTLIDIPGIKELADQPRTRASGVMRQVHSLVLREMDVLPSHAHIYIWNDAVLLLAFLDNNLSVGAVLHEADCLKRKIDILVGRCGLDHAYAIAVRGRAFPDLAIDPDAGGHDRAVVIKASSYALANCFIIEARLGKKLKKPWYVDSRLAKHLTTKSKPEKRTATLLPRKGTRDIYVYSGYLWDEASDC